MHIAWVSSMTVIAAAWCTLHAFRLHIICESTARYQLRD